MLKTGEKRVRREKRGCRRAGGWTDERTCSAVWGRKGREEGRKGHRSAREKRSPEWASSFFCHLDPLNFSQIAHARARAASEGRGAGPGLGGTTNKWLFASVLLLLLLFLRLDSRMEWRRPEGKCHFAVRESKDAARTLPPLARRVNGRGNTHAHPSISKALPILSPALTVVAGSRISSKVALRVVFCRATSDCTQGYKTNGMKLSNRNT